MVKKLLQQEEIFRKDNFPCDEIQQILRYGAFVGSQIEWLKKTQRCMDLAKQRIKASEEKDLSFHSGTIYIAQELTGSRGRFMRGWHAPQGGLWLCLAVVDTLLPESSVLYSLAAGVACCETVRHFQVDAKIKWVNDILVGRRKLAGVLVETFVGKRHHENYVLIGIGLNVNNQTFPPELSGISASMASFTGHELSISNVADQLISKLAWNIGLLHYVEQERLAGVNLDLEAAHPLVDSWKKLSDSIGRKVRYGYNVVETPQYKARVAGIDNLGQLIMDLEDGSRVTENSGEIAYLD